MEKKTTQYLKNYFNHNGVVLLCELLIVLLLSVICTILIGGEPAWLAPALAVVAYLLAELRFMMAYIAKCVKRDRAAEAAAAEEDDLPENEEELDAEDESDSIADDIVEEETEQEVVEEEVEGPVAVEEEVVATEEIVADEVEYEFSDEDLEISEEEIAALEAELAAQEISLDDLEDEDESKKA